MKKIKRFAVIGLGKFGFFVAKTLYEDGNEIIAIDVDRNRVQAIKAFCSEAIVMDATENEPLKSLGLEIMDGVIVSTGINISISILISLHLHEIGVKKILAKALDEDHAKILSKVGATEIIHPEKDMAVRVARGLSMANILDFIPLEEDYNLVQVGPPSAFIGKSLKDLNLRAKYKVYVIAVKELVPKTLFLFPRQILLLRKATFL